MYFRKTFTLNQKDKAEADRREIVKILFAKEPKILIVAHNHPNGLKFPSEEDDCFTAELNMLCIANNVILGDHIIVGKDGCYSYHMSGKLDKIKDMFFIPSRGKV